MRFFERRTGFDRRTRSAVLRTLQSHPWALVAVLAAIVALSCADWAMTRMALAHGATEANLLLAPYVTTEPFLVLGFKVCVALAVDAGVWSFRRYRLVLATAVAALVTYVALIAYQLWGLTQIGAW